MSHQKTVALVLARLRGAPRPKGDSKAKGDRPSEGELTAAEEALASIQEDDSEALAIALKAFIKICVDGGYDEEEDEEDEATEDRK